MSIKKFGVTFTAILSGIAVVTAGLQLSERWQAYDRATAAYTQEALLASGFGVAGGLTVERGPVNSALSNPAPASATVLKEFEANRLETDSALNRLQLLAKEAGGTLASEVDALRTRINKARTDAAAEWQKPATARPRGIADTIMGEYGQAIGGLDGFLHDGIKLTMRLSPDAGNLLDIAQKGWEIRQVAAINSLLISKLLIGSRPAAQAERDLMNLSTGRVQEVWTELLDRGDDSHAPAITRAGVARARDSFFGANRPIRERLIKAAFDGTPYDATIDEWRKSAVAANASLMGIRDAALEDARTLAERDQKASARGMAVAGFAILCVLLLVGGFMHMFLRRIVTPIVRLASIMGTLAEGGDVEVPYSGRMDEVGGMAKALSVFKENSQRIVKLNVEREQAVHRDAEQRRALLMDMANRLETDMHRVVVSVGDVAGRMQKTATTMTTTAAETSAKATSVAAASTESTASIQSVAAAAEELSNSISGINDQVSTSAAVADTAVQQARSAMAQVRGLTEATGKVSQVVALIEDIAAKTNLLALNATIEAARAGDAGKGFAVVASEVKGLANQTARATADIGAQITAMQRTASDTATVISGIAETIERINQTSLTISAAMRQQGTTTQEIAQSTQTVANATADFGRIAVSVDAAAQHSAQASEQVVKMADEMRHEADDLSQKVEGFLAGLRAA